MSKNYTDISQIEPYLRGSMDAAKQQDFEAQLATDEALQAEVAAYRQILTGFDGLREDAFASDVAKWTAEAKAKGDGAKVVTMPHQARVRTMWLKAALAACIVLMVGVGAAWWGSSQYSNRALVASAYVALPSGGTMGEESVFISEMDAMLAAAHDQFQREKYAEAARQFENIINMLRRNSEFFDPLTMRTWFDNARWTGLLAKFAAGQITETEMKTELDAIINDPASEYGDKAAKLKGDLDSFWRRF